jgi:hypothetical protein
MACSHYCAKLRNDTFSCVLTSTREKNFWQRKLGPLRPPASEVWLRHCAAATMNSSFSVVAYRTHFPLSVVRAYAACKYTRNIHTCGFFNICTTNVCTQKHSFWRSVSLVNEHTLVNPRPPTINRLLRLLDPINRLT